MVLPYLAVVPGEEEDHHNESCHQGDLFVQKDVGALEVEGQVHQVWALHFRVGASGPVNEAHLHWLQKVNRRGKSDGLVCVIEYGVVVGEEVESKDPVFLRWSVHELDNTLVARPFEPLVSWDHISLAADVEIDVWD